MEDQGWRNARVDQNDRMVGKVILVLIGIVVIAAIFGAKHSQSTAIPMPAIGNSAITAWYNAHSAVLNSLANDTSAIGAAGDAQSWSLMLGACHSLQQDTATAKAIEAIPDPEAAAHFRASLIYISSAADDCVAASLTQSAPLLNRASSEIGQGTAELRQTVTAIQSAMK
jgi:hypothetical protein